MALDDYIEPEVGVAVAVTAAVLSPPVRRFMRRGAVLGLAGLLMAGDAVASFAQGMGRGMQQAAASAAGAAQGAADQVRPGSRTTANESATQAEASS